MLFLIPLLGFLSLVSSKKVNGNLSSGPLGQGNCSVQSNESDIFNCSNGASCVYDGLESTFECTGGGSSPLDGLKDNNDNSRGPPGRSDCHSHGSHFDCDDGSFCEQINGVWLCESTASENGSTCIVHAGHTHGDCSGQCDNIDTGDYNKDLHIVAVFILLISSCIGVTSPLLLGKWKENTVIKWTLFSLKHFGTGVILCTALIHLLYHAFVMFSNDCLEGIIYEPVAAAIALGGVYLVFLIDYFGMRWNTKRTMMHVKQISKSDVNSVIDENSIAMKQLKWEVTLLECGIIFHSIMIGVTLGTAADGFVPFFIAIVFHQFFEGLGLGSRLCLIKFEKGDKIKKVIMCGWFTVITSIGIAIGIGVRESYSPNSKSTLLAIGILDGISAGILLYASLVELIANDYFKSQELKSSSVIKTATAILTMILGSLLMAILGKWA